VRGGGFKLNASPWGEVGSYELTRVSGTLEGEVQEFVEDIA